MKLSMIYSKTAKGAAEVAARSDALTPAMRRVLIMVDGRRTAAELELVARDREFESILGALLEKGMIEPAGTAGAAHADAIDDEATVAAQPPVGSDAIVASAPGARAAAHAPKTSALEARTPSLGARKMVFAIVAVLAGAGAFAWWRTHDTTPPTDARAAIDTEGKSVAAAPPSAPPVAGQPPATAEDSAAKAVAEPARAEPAPTAGADPQRIAAAPAPRSAAPRATPTAAAPSAPQAATNPRARAPAATPVPAAESVAAQREAPSAAASAAAPAPPPASAPLPVAEPQSADRSVAAVEAPVAAAPPAAQAAPAPRAALVPIAQPRPSFPADVMREGVTEGRVLARLAVDADGRVRDVRILESSPRRAFDREVRNTALRWRYQPPGEPRDIDVEFVFRVDS